MQEQLGISTRTGALIDLFREWDDDGNGAIDKKEPRVGALGRRAQDAIDVLRRLTRTAAAGSSSTSSRRRSATRASRRLARRRRGVRLATSVAAGRRRRDADVVGAGEEDFEAGMRQNAERDAADADQDGKLNDEFGVRARPRGGRLHGRGLRCALSEDGRVRSICMSTCSGR